MNNKCVYCLTASKSITQSHVIPDSLGGSVIIENAVCKKCNEQINKNVEMPIRDALSLIRGLLEIKSRKRKSPSVKVISEFKDLRCAISLVHLGEIDKEILVFKKSDGKQIACFGTKEKIEDFKHKYEAKHANVKWEEIELPDKLSIEACLDMSVLYSDAGLRLACKIAFELFIHTRGVDAVFDNGFDSLRKYVLSGKLEEGEPLVSIVTSPAILNSLNNIPFGIHAIVFSPTTDRSFVALVGLFGIVYYKVIIQKFYPIITQMQPLYLLNPQSRILYEPHFQYKTVPLRARDKDHLVEPERAFGKISDYVISKMNSDLKTIRASNNT